MKKYQYVIKSFKKYTEAISGTTDTMPFGPGMDRQKLQNTIDSSDTTVVYDDITDKIYSEDEYNSLYNLYIKKGGNPLFGFNKENLQKVLSR